MFKIPVATSRAVRASDAAYDFVMGTEGGYDAEGNPKPKNRAFQDPGDPVTIGFGHTGPIRIKGEYRKPMIGEVISTEYARTLFVEDAQMAEDRIDKYFSGINLTQGQRDALFSFCFNIAEKWLKPENNTWLRHFLNGTLTFEILAEYLPQYVNPRTVFEQGLYRRRLWELCVFLGLDPVASRLEAWKAELWRDKNKEIKHRTDPLFVVLSAEAETKKIAPSATVSPPPERAPEPEAHAPVDDGSGVAAEAPAPVARGYEETEPVVEKSTEEPAQSVPEKKATEVAEPAPKPAPAPRARKHVPYPKPPKVDPTETQMTKPEFWSMNMLLSGRLLLALGLIPATMTDLVTDPNFIAMIAGVGVIYGAMISKWRASRKADKRREEKRKAEIKDALDALRAQMDAGLIEFDDYETEVRDLMGAE